MSDIISRVEVDEDIIQVKLLNVEKNSLFVSDIFETISKHKVNIDMISAVNLEEEMRIDFTCEDKDFKKLNDAIRDIKKKHHRIELFAYRNAGKLIVEGYKMKDEPGVAAKVFKILGENHIPFTQVTTSEISISFVLDKKYLYIAKEKIEEGI